jgi:putative membrane protein
VEFGTWMAMALEFQLGADIVATTVNPSLQALAELTAEAGLVKKRRELMATPARGLKNLELTYKKGFPMHADAQKVNVSNELARERSRQAADRTLMAWVRTALSLIGFGFGVAQFRDILVRTELVARRSPEYPSTALYFGLAFISLGVLGLLAATIQHWRILQHIKQDEFHYSGFRPLVFIMATGLITIGVLAFIAIVAQRSLQLAG